jgi:membrane-associated protein
MLDAVMANPGIIEYLTHFPDYLAATIGRYREWTYVLMFVILVAETGLIFFGWLPGDTMLFTAGVLASAARALDVRMVLLLMSVAAFTGDQLNYLMGVALARNARIRRAPTGGRGWRGWRVKAAGRFAKAQSAYAHHGGLVVIIGRFIPVLSSIAPLGAAVSGMRYASFVRYSAAGCILWTATFTLAGYFFGKIPWVRNHFWIAVFGIISFSILSALVEARRAGRASRRSRGEGSEDSRPGWA